ncbi:Fasciclin-like arabinogalactan protein 6 [Camellia lanceoleosa]|uniref:Fasciclin-like arabinogalactan protein 6 n=1 Tax=Camellia lanceoleosa TaxID=1840588 RepID=A0ACC0H596_9ERIC|nr:Fasciclin-like arabinogalactan protein 6 [Camellia lanceoleosa]
MASTPVSSIILSLTSLLFLLLTPHIQAQSPSAPSPSPSGPINITDILVKGGQYNILIRLLTSTQVANQINNQVNNSNDGMTVFAPTDNAFSNLPSGTLNNLSAQQQVQLVLYHVLPKYYSLPDLLTVSNPVRTQASGQDGGVFGLDFSGAGSQVNVSTGIVETIVNTALRSNFPLAVYSLDKVLLPKEFYEAKAPAPAPTTNVTSSSSNSTKSAASPPSPASGSGRLQMRVGLVASIVLFCMGLF